MSYGNRGKVQQSSIFKPEMRVSMVNVSTISDTNTDLTNRKQVYKLIKAMDHQGLC